MVELQSREKTWVWFSTVESAAAGKISVLAVAETLMLTTGGFYVWIYYDWFSHLLFGLAIAPLFYLRTPESAESAVRWLDPLPRRLLSVNTSSNKRLWFALTAWLGVGFISALALALLLHWLGLDPYWVGFSAGFWVGFSVGWAAVTTYVIAAVTAFAPAPGVRSLTTAVILAAGGITAAGAAVAAVGTGAAVAAIVGFAAATLAEFLVAVIQSRARAKGVAATIAKVIGDSLMSVGIVLAMLVLATLVRFGAGLLFFGRAPLKTLQRIPENWRHHNFFLDSAHPPEVLPEAERHELSFRFSKLWGKRKEPNAEKVLFVVLGAILYVPAVAFRYSMKAGAWVWLPLVWLLRRHDGKGDRGFLEGESKDFWAHLRLLYALVILIVLTLGAIVLASWLQQHAWHQEALGMIFLFGITKLWTWTRAATALLFLVSYFGSRAIRVARDTRNDPSWGAIGVAALRYLYRVRSVFALFTLAVSAWLVATQMVDWSLLDVAWTQLQILPGIRL